jgi:hypothetical protein
MAPHLAPTIRLATLAAISAHGESSVTARLEPTTIDGLVYCSSMVVLYAARHQLRAPALARWLLIRANGSAVRQTRFW